MGHGTHVGERSSRCRHAQRICIVRLQAPRFFVEKDEVVLSANVHNYLKTAKQVTVALELDGKCLAALTDTTRQVRSAQRRRSAHRLARESRRTKARPWCG